MAEFAAALAPELTIQWVNAIASVPQDQWDALALPLETPFFEWEWLHQIEASGSATPQTGWLPHHLLVWRDRQGQRELVAAAPLYLKGHSQGEFVFDHQWADLATRLGIRYYPKLLGMAPFTPAVGYRFLMAEGVDEVTMTKVMLHEIDRLCQRHRLSSCHFLYVDPQWQPAVEAYGYRPWLHHSYIWQNRNYQTFDDYLADFNANQRRNIKRERKAVAQADFTFRVHRGDEVSRTLLRQMYDFYADTCDKFGWWGSKYLTRQFFEALSDRYRHRVVLFAAYPRNGGQRPIAMSFCITKGANLYGRYWGSAREIDCLHFNACYYEPIEWAIANGIQRFDPGAGGRHKKRRGFPATPNYSLHRFYEPRLAQIFDHYIDEINDEEQRLIDTINADLPMKSL
ncbi:GNAT family N-acetyltransferase [Thermosynechococcus sp. HN-54]|uniref:GNAT family N-acetyltransferase n=1 Tax=Thermosynechococcus sp. HN-54 TaxID=2933959 RepID=UPI00202CEAB9|nr:GNAT family N-acetyltransferase [Thermosynechococcus sp. HN-54]URR36771.1 GNAT family N-acetyltransferase [Thermosynechococcus sp. HN-54]